MRRALLLILLGTSVAAAQPKKAPAKAAPAKTVPPPRGNYVPPPQPTYDTTPHREGEYTGVSPHGTAPKDKPRTKIRPAKGTLSWIGFEAKDGGAQLFFQSVAAFNVTQKLEKDTLVVHLSLPRLGQNTWRQIDTRYFDNPLSFVIARASRGGTRTPWVPAETTSGIAPTEVAITGTPAAIASSSAYGSPSA